MFAKILGIPATLIHWTLEITAMLVMSGCGIIVAPFFLLCGLALSAVALIMLLAVAVLIMISIPAI